MNDSILILLPFIFSNCAPSENFTLLPIIFLSSPFSSTLYVFRAQDVKREVNQEGEGGNRTGAPEIALVKPASAPISVIIIFTRGAREVFRARDSMI